MNLRCALLIVGMAGSAAAAGFFTGTTYQASQTKVMEWNDGLVAVECTPGEQTVSRGAMFYEDDDRAMAIIGSTWDPETTDFGEEKHFEMDPKTYPLGCFVRGLRQEEIMERERAQNND